VRVRGIVSWLLWEKRCLHCETYLLDNQFFTMILDVQPWSLPR
jgi:hypothetical protein